jgi:hypothetical protein
MLNRLACAYTLRPCERQFIRSISRSSRRSGMSEVHRSAACPQPGQGFPVVSDELHRGHTWHVPFFFGHSSFFCGCDSDIGILG